MRCIIRAAEDECASERLDFAFESIVVVCRLEEDLLDLLVPVLAACSVLFKSLVPVERVQDLED